MVLQFEPFHATIHPTFWQELSSVKIDQLQLSDEAVPICAQYFPGRVILDRQTGSTVSLGSALHLDAASLRSAGPASLAVQAQGMLKNFNTIEDFKAANKQALFDVELQKIWHGILTDQRPEQQLSRFFVLTFADLKKSRFIYWFAYPALVLKPSWELDLKGWKPITDELDDNDAACIRSFLQNHSGFFLFLKQPDGTPEVASISSFDSFFRNVPEDKRYVGFVDPSGTAHTPGWPLRNFLTYLHARFVVDDIQVICWKDEPGFNNMAEPVRSVVGRVYLPEAEPGSTTMRIKGQATRVSCKPDNPVVPLGVGWERNSQDKLAPKVADLGPLMNPRELADQAVDLNLKLMRWRIMPEINLEKIQSTKCLLLGAGTLGCYVARTLLGWGVRHVTFVDSSTVSYSNPVRQPLFDFEDCLDGGKPKAACAAAKLAKIYPGVTSRGVQLSVPMPGHPVSDASVKQVRKSVEELEALFDEHDVIYLLMDSRESRWLPTVLGAAKDKLVINAALGFDSYLVMRHGSTPLPTVQDKIAWHGRLGCYFCNDVVAPADSLTDRTLDQMCTVTRPGLAAIAGASAVELMVSVLQHHLGVHAPASAGDSGKGEVSTRPDEASTVLGIIPHQLRGFLAQFHNLRIIGQAYDRCTGCSESVVNAYLADGFDMLLRAFNDQKFLEQLTGLDKMYQEAEDMEAALDWDEDDDALTG